MPEDILEPDLPIVDPHHHLWDLRALVPSFPEPLHPFLKTIGGAAHYTFDHLHADTHSGHNVIATVFMECGAFYNPAYGPVRRTRGEIEFVDGVAAQSASGLYGDYRACAKIVGHADLTADAENLFDYLDELQGRFPRFCGVRHQGAWDADPEVLGPPFHAAEGLYASSDFRRGFAELNGMGLTFDAWVLEPQLPEVIELARVFPDQTIVLDHCGTPLGIAGYSGTLPETFDRWSGNIRELAKSPNVSVKLGGLAMPFCAMPAEGPAKGTGSETLAELWRPYIETCIEAFGPRRAMFESNYPVDRWGAEYPVLWNAFKRITANAGTDEKAALYSGTAGRVYGLSDVLPA